MQAINKLYNSQKALSEAKGTVMSIEIPDALELRADSNIFVSVLRNMLDTTRKYTTQMWIYQRILGKYRPSNP